MKIWTSFSFFIFCLVASVSIAPLTTSIDTFSTEFKQSAVNPNNKGVGGGGSDSGGGVGVGVGVGGGYFGPGSGFNIPGWGKGFGNGIIPGAGAGYGAGYGGPNGGYSRGGVVRPLIVCKVKGPCYQKKLRCPAKCFSSSSRAGKGYGGGGGGGGCTIDCKKKCVAYC